MRTIEKDTIKVINKSSLVMLTASATINNVVRNIERRFPAADHLIIKDALNILKNAAGDLSEQWEDLDMELATSDLLDA
jgi:hypothetical protein